jgi:two-component system, LytTR family, response regulator
MDKIRVLIVDDEPLGRKRIRNLLRPHPEMEILQECKDGFEAVSAIRNGAPDLVFLDVQMPEKDGFQVLDEVGAENIPAIIFVTAYDQYAVPAFEVHALDYLLKPFGEKRFEKSLELARARIQGGANAESQQRLLALVQEWKKRTNYLRRVMVKNKDRMTFLETRQIDWIKAEGNYACLHSGKGSFLLRETINRLDGQLDPLVFMRIHRSAIVRIDFIKEIQQMFHGAYRVILKDGTRLPLSRTYRSRLPRTADEC